MEVSREVQDWEWLRKNYEVGKANGVVYFGDDDNTYDFRVFEEVLPSQMKSTKKFTVNHGQFD